MPSELITLSASAAADRDEASTIVSAAGLTLHLMHLQKQKEVVLIINPAVDGYDDKTLTLEIEKGTRFKIFDIHQRTSHRFAADGKDFELEFMTWSRPDQDTIRFDFELRYD